MSHSLLFIFLSYFLLCIGMDLEVLIKVQMVLPHRSVAIHRSSYLSPGHILQILIKKISNYGRGKKGKEFLFILKMEKTIRLKRFIIPCALVVLC